jgi:hypothetical protein
MTKSLRVANIFALFALGAVGLYFGLRILFPTPTSSVQAAWTTAGVLGSIVTALNLRAALRDKAAVIAGGHNGDRLFLANDYIRIETVRLCQMLAVAGVGFYLLQAAPVLTATQRKALHLPVWTPASIILTAVLLGIVFGTVLQAVLDRRTRLRFEHRGSTP